MENRKNINTVAIICFCLLFVMACGQANIALPTETPTQTTIPSTPTKTPRPTSTPNVAKTQNFDDIFSEVQKFADEGLIPSPDGIYETMDDFNESIAKRGWLQYWYFDFTIENFVYKAHVRWNTAGETSETSGCGIVFRVVPKEGGDSYYGMVLDKSRIYFSSAHGGYYYELGKTRGAGTLDFGNPAEADLTLLVQDNTAYVYVDDEFIGEYTLSLDMPTRGKFGYGIISGTNRDYGTQCEITNSRIWKLNK
jgi:hypothetical protein